MFESKKKIEMWVSCGNDFFYGLEGEKKDLEMAVDFYEKAAKKKHPHAAFMLGLCYELGGKGVEKNIETAEEWYRLAAGYGSDEARKRLESETVAIPPPPADENEVEDEDETEDAPEIESVEEDDETTDEDDNPPYENHFYVDNLDLHALSYEALMGTGSICLAKKNIQNAIDYFEYAALRFLDGEAAFFACRACMADVEEMQDNTMYVKRAIWWLIVAVNLGNEEAKVLRAKNDQIVSISGMSLDDMLELADFYEKNEDYLRAWNWYVQAGGEKNSLGAYWAGRYYYEGKGISRNYAKAAEWLEKSLEYGEYAKSGGFSAMYYIGKIYLAGGYGIDVDLKKALGWLKKAELDSYACEALAQVYEKLGDDNNAVKYSGKALKLMEKEEKKR